MRSSALIGLIFLAACSADPPQPSAAEPCSPGWEREVETRVGTGDGQGHGPDVGSAEWQSVIEFRLGVRGNADLPPRGSDAWCRYIEKSIRAKTP